MAAPDAGAPLVHRLHVRLPVDAHADRRRRAGLSNGGFVVLKIRLSFTRTPSDVIVSCGTAALACSVTVFGPSGR